MHTTAHFVLALSLLLPFGLGCGDDGVAADTGAADTGLLDTGADAPMADGAPADTGGSDTGAADSSGGDAGMGDTGTGDSGTGDGSTSDGASDASTAALVISEVSVGAWANCMPSVPPDPLRFFIELSYDNTAGSSEATAIITSAHLTFDDPGASATDIDFDVEMVTVAAGATAMQMHHKTASSPVLDSCSICAGERLVSYELTLSVGGATQAVSGSTSFGCTF